MSQSQSDPAATPPQEADRPPDRRAAAAAAKRARRILRDSRGMVWMVLGAYITITTAAFLIFGASDQYVLIVVLGGIAVYFVARRLVRYVRSRRGLHAEPSKKRKLPRSRAEVIYLNGVAVGVLVYLIAGVILAAMRFPEPASTLIRLSIMSMVALWITLAHWFVRGQWEDVPVGLAFMMGMWCAQLSGNPVALELRFMALGVTVIASGLVKHLRWRQWAQSLPPQPSRADSEATA